MLADQGVIAIDGEQEGVKVEGKKKGSNSDERGEWECGTHCGCQAEN